MIRVQIGRKVATIRGNRIEARNTDLRRELRLLAFPFEDHPGYLPPPEEPILEAIRARYPGLKILKKTPSYRFRKDVVY